MNEFVTIDVPLASTIKDAPEYRNIEKFLSLGCYIAGGAARVMLVETLGINLIIDPLNKPQGQPPTEWFWKDYTRHIGGDIDLWCHSHAEAQACFAKLLVLDKENVIYRSKTLTGSAEEFWCRTRLPNATALFTNVQLITRYAGTPEEVMSRFDLLAAKVAFDGTKFIVDKRWEKFERNHVLHVDSWTTPFVFSRIKKWAHKHKYTKLSEQSDFEISVEIERWKKKLNEIPSDVKEKDRPWHGMRASSVEHVVKSLIDVMSFETALYVGSTILDHYGPMKAIWNLSKRVTLEENVKRMIEIHSEMNVSSPNSSDAGYLEV